MLTAARMTTRLVLGIPDDLTWRAAHVTIGELGRFVGLTATVVVVTGGLWLFDALRTTDLPVPPAVSRRGWYPVPPPPPPPPPPRSPLGRPR